MVFTRSQLKNISITSEMREYFENLMKTLGTNKQIEDKFKEQNDRI